MRGALKEVCAFIAREASADQGWLPGCPLAGAKLTSNGAAKSVR